jgi:hypothetical protein
LGALKKRREVLEETVQLGRQNEELRGLLRHYLGSNANDGLVVPPSASL